MSRVVERFLVRLALCKLVYTPLVAAMLTASRRHTDSTTAATARIHPPTQVSLNQMKRAQALMRLGVTEDDLRTAERLFAELPVGDGVSCCFQRTILFHNTVEYPSVSRGSCRLL
jgi:hypothetical protein